MDKDWLHTCRTKLIHQINSTMEFRDEMNTLLDECIHNGCTEQESELISDAIVRISQAERAYKQALVKIQQAIRVRV